jgi:L-ascorbate metabolism protein UlaG (beta-lactamase superfamily)
LTSLQLTSRSTFRLLAIQPILLLLAACSTLPASEAAEPPGEILLSVPLEPQPPSESAAQSEPAAPEPLEPVLVARLNWEDEFGDHTIVFDTSGGPVKLRQVGFGSLMMKFGETVVHVNPWSQAADYQSLPKADQIWITDPLPEHLDVHAIRAVSQESTQLIVDEASAEQLRGLLPFIQLRGQVEIAIDEIELMALPAFRAEMLPDGARLNPSNSYLATYGDFRVLLAGQAHFIPEAGSVEGVDIILLSLDDLISLSAEQAAAIAGELSPAAIFPYEYGDQDPSILAELLKDTRTMVIPLEASKDAGPKPLGIPPDRSSAIAELYLNGQEPAPELLAELFGAQDQVVPLLLPDLQTLSVSQIRINHNSFTDTTLLRLTNSVWNAGFGPLELWGKVSENGDNHAVVQRIFDQNGEYQERFVGEFLFHPGHNHWHLDSFSLYELWSLQENGNLDSVVATSGKVSYCLRDIRRVPHPDQAPRMGYGTCTYGRQGLSIGWADVYDYYLPGQSIEISGIPDGTYALMSIADPYNLIQESDETNNAIVIYLQIEGHRVTVLDSES